MGVNTKTRVFNTALPDKDTKILPTDIIPNFDLSELRIHCAISKSGRLSLTRKDLITGVTISELLGTANVGANEGVTYTVPIRAVCHYNMTFSVTSGTILVLQVDEVSQ